MLKRSWMCVVIATGLAACEGSGGGSRAGRHTEKPGEADFPASVNVGGGNAELGFLRGRLRKNVELPAFRVARHPLTVAEFRACVAAGACQMPSDNECTVNPDTPLGRTNIEDGSGEAPAVCVGPAQAVAHCAWLGGELPTVAQWMLAARGKAPRRFAWGDAAPTCSQHPGGSDPVEEPQPGERVSLACDRAADRASLFEVAKHAAGASEAGVEDVLLAPGELVRAEPENLYSACSTPFDACVVFGVENGAIDSVEAVRIENEPAALAAAEGALAPPEPSPGRVQHAYAYRCVWSHQ